jgi:two-component system, OmpR family, response regulator MprA
MSETVQSRPSPVAPGRVLVVDDEPDVRGAIEAALELEGDSAATAVDGLEALNTLSKAEFDAIVLDVLMPNMDGFEVCRRLRRNGNRTPILILTARDSERTRSAAWISAPTIISSSRSPLGELLARVRALLRRNLAVDEDGPVWFRNSAIVCVWWFLRSQV